MSLRDDLDQARELEKACDGDLLQAQRSADWLAHARVLADLLQRAAGRLEFHLQGAQCSSIARAATERLIAQIDAVTQ